MIGPVVVVSAGVFAGVLLSFFALATVAHRFYVARHRCGLPSRNVMLAAIVLAALTVAVAPALVPIAVVVAFVVPPARRRWIDHREQRAGEAELPDVLESVARALRAGASLGQAVADAPVPRATCLRDEWLRMRAAVPVSGVAAAVDAVWRPLRDRQLVAGSLRLAADVGGPQARALDLAAATLRQRLAFQEEVRAQSAQARASALVVAGAPVAFAFLAAATDPRYVPFLFRTVPGATLLYAGLALDALGLAWMTRLARGATGGTGGQP